MPTRIHGNRRVVIGIVGALFCLQTSGCYNWRVAPIPGPEAKTDTQAEYEMTTRDGRTTRLVAVHIRHDSLFGTPRGAGKEEVGVPTSQITVLKLQKFNTLATLGTAALVTLVLGAAAVAASDGLSFGPGGSGGSYFGSGTNFSCPLVYSWDGQRYHLDSGTFGGAITPALARTDLDNLMYVRPEHGVLRFLLTDEANETEHIDAFTVVAVDHPAGTEIAPDARANGTFHVLQGMVAPVAARDFMGRDALAQVTSLDGRSWESRIDGRNPDNAAHLRDGLELSFARPSGNRALLVLDAQNTPWAAQLMGEMVSAFGRETAKWYSPTTSAAASLPLAHAQHAEGFLAASIWDGKAWRPAGEIWEAGPEVAKRQVLPVDLDGINGDTIRIRIESAPSFWLIDAARLAPVTTAVVIARDLPIHTAAAPRTATALAQLSTKDGAYLDMEQGDTVRVTVRDTLSRPSHGMVRSYLARTTGWYRIHGRDNADPDMAVLAELARGPHGGARVAVTRLNEALAILDREAKRVAVQ